MSEQRYHWLGVRAYETDTHRTADLMGAVGDLDATGIELSRYQITDGGRWLDYSLAALEADAEDILEMGFVRFEGDQRVEGTVSLRFRPSASVEMRGDAVDGASIERWLLLSRRWQLTTRPNFMVLGFGPLGPQRDGWTIWNTQAELDARLVAEATFVQPADYWPRGPHGLGLRTYFGAPFVKMFGEGRLLSTPGVVTQTEDGGVWIDVHEDLIGAPYRDLLGAWRRCSDHLAPAEVFAPPEIDEERKRVRFKRAGANYLRPSKRS